MTLNSIFFGEHLIVLFMKTCSLGSRSATVLVDRNSNAQAAYEDARQRTYSFFLASRWHAFLWWYSSPLNLLWWRMWQMVSLGEDIFLRCLSIQIRMSGYSQRLVDWTRQFQGKVAVYALEMWFLECHMAMCELSKRSSWERKWSPIYCKGDFGVVWNSRSAKERVVPEKTPHWWWLV